MSSTMVEPLANHDFLRSFGSMRPAVKLVPRRDRCAAARFSRYSRSRSPRRAQGHDEGDGKVEVKIMKLGSAQLVV